MRPLFTIHAGEYLTALHIEKHYRRARVWVPSQDTGLDLLISDRRHRRTLALQVKYSKDFLPHMGLEFRRHLRARGWWTLDRDKLRRSDADLWVFVLPGFAAPTVDYLLIPPRDLARRLQAVHGLAKRLHIYLTVSKSRHCFETRGVGRDDLRRIVRDEYRHPRRDLTPWLNNWERVAALHT
jgi:hypothetical protein